MATRSYRVDDLDSTSEVTETGQDTTVALNGRTVTLDLSDKHFQELEKFLEKYFKNGVEVKARKTSAKATSNEDADRNVEIRAWRQNQVRPDLPEVKDRGRLPQAVLEAYAKEVENHANADTNQDQSA